MNENYFEGYLQLRDCNEELIDYVLKRLDDEKVIVTGFKKMKNGVNMKVSSNKFLSKLSKELSRKFSGEIKQSKKLFSQDHLTGKEIFRCTLYFKQLPYSVGDIIEYRGEKVKIVSLSGKITAKNVKSGKKFFIET